MLKIFGFMGAVLLFYHKNPSPSLIWHGALYSENNRNFYSNRGSFVFCRRFYCYGKRNIEIKPKACNNSDVEEAALKLKEISDDIGEIIFERTEEVIEKRDDVYQAIEKKKAEYETWSRRYKELLEERISGHNRLLSAFPKMKSLYANDALLKLRDHWKKTEKDRKEQEK